jgi:hypothetical protein
MPLRVGICSKSSCTGEGCCDSTYSVDWLAACFGAFWRRNRHVALTDMRPMPRNLSSANIGEVRATSTRKRSRAKDFNESSMAYSRPFPQSLGREPPADTSTGSADCASCGNRKGPVAQPDRSEGVGCPLSGFEEQPPSSRQNAMERRAGVIAMISIASLSNTKTLLRLRVEMEVENCCADASRGRFATSRLGLVA